jgi:hypothetical protein
MAEVCAMEKLPTRKLRHWELDRYWLGVAALAIAESWDMVWGKIRWRSIVISSSTVVLSAILQFVIVGWNGTVENLEVVGTSLAAGLFLFVVLVVLGIIRKPCELDVRTNEQVIALKAENAKLKDVSESHPQRSTNVAERDWIGEWGESKQDFIELESSDVFAEVFQGNCAVRSDHDPLARDKVEAACGLAGSRLVHSPGMILSQTVQSEKENWKRWLYFLKETQGLTRTVSVSGSSDDGYIEHLAQQSALACTKCKANAFGNAVTDQPKRTSAERYHYEVARVALGKIGQEAVIALRHLKIKGTLTFGFYPPPLPIGMTNDRALAIYNECLTEELVTRRGTEELTFEIAAPMQSVLDELLYESHATTSPD